MNIQQVISDFRTVCDHIEARQYAGLLDVLSNNILEGRFYLPFIGQFSAGKSKLINRLLGEEILPTKSIETTAFLTQIEYCEEKSAVLYFEDGTYQSISLDEVHNLDHNAAKQTKAISSLRIGFPADILKSGIVLIDTPGVNTLINNHIRITEELLSKSQYIVYVFNSSLSKIDVQMIERVEKMGIPMIFVRTHIDMIDSSEEIISDTLKCEQEGLKEKLGRDVDYFPMCNNPQKEAFLEWEESFISFRDLLGTEIANNVESTLVASAIQRLSVIQKELQSQLIRKREILKSSGEKDSDSICLELQAIEEQRERLLTTLKQKTKEQEVKCEALKSEIVASSDEAVSTSVRTFKSRVQNLGSDYIEAGKAMYQKCLFENLDSISKSAEDKISRWAKKHIDEIGTELSSCNVSAGNLEIDIDTNFDVNMVAAYAEKEDALITDFMEKKAQIESLRNMNDLEAEQLKDHLSEITAAVAEYDSWVHQQNAEVQEYLNLHQPQYVTKESGLAKKLKAVGKVADVATLLIPVAGWEKAGVSLAAKAGKMAAKGGKAAQVASKALSGLGKGAQIMAKTDTVLDGTKIANAVIKGTKMNENQIEKAKSAGLFDYLSIAYWMERIGESIDPTTVEIDQEYENQKKEYLEIKRQEANQKAKERLEILKQKGEIRDQIELHQRKQLLLAAELDKLQQEMSQKQNALEREKQSAAKSCILDRLGAQFEEVLLKYAEMIKSRAQDNIDYLLEEISNAVADKVNTQLESVSKALSELACRKKQGEISLSEVLSSLDADYELLQFEKGTSITID